LQPDSSGPIRQHGVQGQVLAITPQICVGAKKKSPAEASDI